MLSLLTSTEDNCISQGNLREPRLQPESMLLFRVTWKSSKTLSLVYSPLINHTLCGAFLEEDTQLTEMNQQSKHISLDQGSNMSSTCGDQRYGSQSLFDSQSDRGTIQFIVRNGAVIWTGAYPDAMSRCP